jgi:uncharacterized protein
MSDIDSRYFLLESHMHNLRTAALASLLAALTLTTYAQTSNPPTGTLIHIPAEGVVKRANDQATATLTIEEQDKDKAVAASRVNKKMKQGSDIVKREDPQAQLTTRSYYTYPVYADEQQKSPVKTRTPIAWRVGQSLEVVTSNLTALPKTVAAAQSILSLNGIYFSLSDNAARKLDEERIAATYKHLTERITFVARAMGRNPADAVVETIDFDGSGNRVQDSGIRLKTMSVASAPMEVSEPSFEPGETALQMQAVGKVRFK